MGVFSNFNSKYKREQYFKDHIVEPVDVPLGIRMDQIWNKEKHIYEQGPVSSRFSYIPILKTLKFLLCNSSFRNLLKQQTNVNSTNALTEFCHGTSYRNSVFFNINEDAFQLQLYFDEFETVNPLGSKTGGHKLGAIYMTVRNLPSQFNSALQNIHLVALFYSDDIKKFGINSVLDIIVKDLKMLETVGIYDDISQKHYKGTLVSLSHDNLGGNQLFGMVESFSATYYCRICLSEKTLAQRMNVQDDKLLRNNDLYEQHCNLLQSSESASHIFGIKCRSLLNNLNNFKLCENPSVDIMHDLLEGVVQLEIKAYLKFLISEKVVTINELNQRIQSFNYGINERANRPSPICLDKLGHAIGQRAAQTLCLIKYLPLILSDKIVAVPNVNKGKYKVLQLLLQIINIVFCPINTIGMVSRLKHLIEEHHALYQFEYDANLVPKHHMMTHYPDLILKMGPLIGLSSMRFEAKHGYFKNLIHSLKNYRSICKTLSFRHQEHMWHKWQNINISFSPVYGKCNTINFNNKTYANELHDFLKITSNNETTSEISVTNSVNILGVSFQKQQFITDKRDALDYPVFSEIIEICVINDNIHLVCKPWFTREYNKIYQAYIIENCNGSNSSFRIIDFKTITHNVSYDMHKPFNTNISAIVPKYELTF